MARQDSLPRNVWAHEWDATRAQWLRDLPETLDHRNNPSETLRHEVSIEFSATICNRRLTVTAGERAKVDWPCSSLCGL